MWLSVDAYANWAPYQAGLTNQWQLINSGNVAPATLFSIKNLFGRISAC